MIIFFTLLNFEHLFFSFFKHMIHEQSFLIVSPKLMALVEMTMEILTLSHLYQSKRNLEVTGKVVAMSPEGHKINPSK